MLPIRAIIAFRIVEALGQRVSPIFRMRDEIVMQLSDLMTSEVAVTQSEITNVLFRKVKCFEQKLRFLMVFGRPEIDPGSEAPLEGRSRRGSSDRPF